MIQIFNCIAANHVNMFNTPDISKLYGKLGVGGGSCIGHRRVFVCMFLVSSSIRFRYLFIHIDIAATCVLKMQFNPNLAQNVESGRFRATSTASFGVSLLDFRS